MMTAYLHKPEDVSALVKAVLHIVFVTRPCAHVHVQWLRCVSKVLDTYKVQLYGKLELDFEQFWDYFASVLEDNTTFQVDANPRAAIIPAAANVCKMVRTQFLQMQTLARSQKVKFGCICTLAPAASERDHTRMVAASISVGAGVSACAALDMHPLFLTPVFAFDATSCLLAPCVRDRLNGASRRLVTYLHLCT